jgi:nicotinamide-nucleotide amidase
VNFAAVQAQVLALGDVLRARGWRIATAESCTGGLVAAACTSVAGSSDWFERGFVSYSNAAKCEMLGVDAGLIEAHGAVSEAVACAMAIGALQHARCDLAASLTGIAGPGGAVPGKPVGTVWLALAQAAGSGPRVSAHGLLLAGDRSAVREAAVAAALEHLMTWAQAPAA